MCVSFQLRNLSVISLIENVTDKQLVGFYKCLKAKERGLRSISKHFLTQQKTSRMGQDSPTCVLINESRPVIQREISLLGFSLCALRRKILYILSP